jgi:uncharacterized protein (UPF0332 family)
MNKEESIRALVEKAEKSLKAATLLFDDGYYDFSASRSYYVMFYCAEALLFTKGLSFSKHSAVISFFGKEFVKTRTMPERLHTFLRDAFDLRRVGDYEAMIGVSKEEAEKTLRRAEEFLKATRSHLGIE